MLVTVTVMIWPALAFGVIGFVLALSAHSKCSELERRIKVLEYAKDE